MSGGNEWHSLSGEMAAASVRGVGVSKVKREGRRNASGGKLRTARTIVMVTTTMTWMPPSDSGWTQGWF